MLPVRVISYSLNSVTSTPEKFSVTLVDAEFVTRMRDVVSSSMRLLLVPLPMNLKGMAGYLASNLTTKSPEIEMSADVCRNLFVAVV